MPLKSGSDDKTVGFNIKELVHSGKAKGHIGTGPHKEGKSLQRQAVAIALNKAGKSNKENKPTKKET
jgi:hypothetical protein